ncbi:hypothetical protein C4D60_Mb09t11480 [Musa balbisiana]|uniref:Uncharacterized protein n=1 Tax=Musa balbisiana TaxID=52838 RepID=A0A4S8IFM7_MUSBA|nr:hypothetical protein C4D60_Mb09t11480 [Musa balbisiana]
MIAAIRTSPSPLDAVFFYLNREGKEWVSELEDNQTLGGRRKRAAHDGNAARKRLRYDDEDCTGIELPSTLEERTSLASRQGRSGLQSMAATEPASANKEAQLERRDVAHLDLLAFPGWRVVP